MTLLMRPWKSIYEQGGCILPIADQLRPASTCKVCGGVHAVPVMDTTSAAAQFIKELFKAAVNEDEKEDDKANEMKYESSNPAMK